MNNELKGLVVQKKEPYWYRGQIGWFLVRGFWVPKETMRTSNTQRKCYQLACFSRKQQEISVKISLYRSQAGYTHVELNSTFLSSLAFAFLCMLASSSTQQKEGCNNSRGQLQIPHNNTQRKMALSLPGYHCRVAQPFPEAPN